eukprot:5386756-Amphidinium_carterae.2
MEEVQNFRHHHGKAHALRKRAQCVSKQLAPLVIAWLGFPCSELAAAQPSTGRPAGTNLTSF